MYRRVNSGRFIGLTTFGIVIVMAVFTWVMYGMAQQVFVMSDIMVELSDSIKAMVALQEIMTTDIHSMSIEITRMNQTVGTMSGSVGAMSTSMGTMTDAMHSMTNSVSRMSYDVGKASYAMSNPMSFMWGSGSPFPF